MTLRSLALATALALLIAGVTLVVVSQPDRADDPAVPFGFNDNAVTQGLASPDQVAGLLSGVGADIDRVQINWATLETQQGAYDFAVYDEIYRADLAAGVQPLFIFAFAPPWAAGDAPCDASESSCHVPPAPEHYDDAARTTAVIAERYPRAAGIEIWNEPNTSYFWAPRPDPVAYAGLLAACYQAIKQVAPETTVAAAGTASGSGATSMPAEDFIRTLLAEGGGSSMDALSIHAYPFTGDVSGSSVSAAVEEIRGIQEEAEETDPIWVTETGVSITGPDAVSDTEQAATVVGLSDALSSVEGVEMVLVHTLIRPPRPPEDPEGGFGVVGADLVPATAYCALSEEWGGEPC